MSIKTHKRKKSSRMSGRGRGTHGWGERKKHKKSGHRGGKGMAGTGKRGDQKKTLITKLYGHGYFGKQGITSKGTKKKKENKINLREIELNLDSYIKKGIAKKIGGGYEINLDSYKILGDSEISEKLGKLIINAKQASKSALEKVKEKGGEIVLLGKKEKKAEKDVKKDVNNIKRE